MAEPADGIAVPEQRVGLAPAERSRTDPALEGGRWDRVRWGPIWAGTLTTLAVFIVLQLLFFSLGWLSLAVTEPNAIVTSVLTVVLGLVAFFVGGLVIGGSVPFRGRRSDGILNGIVMWALAVTLILALGTVGGSALLGAIDGFNVNPGNPGVAGAGGSAPAPARSAAGLAALGLGLTALASALGAGLGTKKSVWTPKAATTSR